MNITINIIFDVLILTFTSIGILSSIGILYLIYRHRRQTPINAPNLLLCNTYVAFIIACLPLLDMYAYNSRGNTTENSSFNNWWCYGRAYLLHVGLCSIYYSYMLQSCFRLFRIVFYKIKQLQNYSFIVLLIIIQWFTTLIVILLILLLHYFQYLSGYYYCQIPFNDLLGLLITASMIYYFPMLVIGSIYLDIIYYMRRTQMTAIQQNRQRNNQKDVIVLHRILILVGMLLILSLPSILLWLGYEITGYLYPFIYHLQWFTVALSLAILPFISAMLTPNLKELITSKWQQRRRVQPLVITQQHALDERV